MNNSPAECVTLTAIDLVEGRWAKFHLSLDSAGRIAVGDMRGLGTVVRSSVFRGAVAELNDPVRIFLPSRIQFQDITSLLILLSISTKVQRFNSASREWNLEDSSLYIN